MREAVWYFDLISPFAYLQSTQLARFSPYLNLTPKPVVFAGLLKHFGNVGPAEIVPKRQWTFEQVAWTAHSLGLTMRLPASHPFNPISMLRAVVAAGSTLHAVQTAFAYVWEQGGNLDDLTKLYAALGIRAEQASTPIVKAELIANGQQAIASQIFGVPTLAVGEHRFWGADSTEMALAYLQGDPWFDSPSYLGVKDFPQGVQRPR